MFAKPYKRGLNLTYQCNRNVCKNADNPSISTKIDSVKIAQNIKTSARAMLQNGIGIMAPILMPFCITIFHRTSDSSGTFEDQNKMTCFCIIQVACNILRAWANESAHNRKYDAVCEIVLNAYSMV